MQGKVEICGVNTATLPVLKSAETRALLEKARGGDREAREKLIAGNLRLVLSVVERFAGRGESAERDASAEKTLGGGTLLLQGVATSIDALSVGFTIEQYPFAAALTESLIIGAVTLAICLAGLLLGRTIGRKLDRIAPILGGLILIGIGVEIFLTGVF